MQALEITSLFAGHAHCELVIYSAEGVSRRIYLPSCSPSLFTLGYRYHFLTHRAISLHFPSIVNSMCIFVLVPACDMHSDINSLLDITAVTIPRVSHGFVDSIIDHSTTAVGIDITSYELLHSTRTARNERPSNVVSCSPHVSTAPLTSTTTVLHISRAFLRKRCL